MKTAMPSEVRRRYDLQLFATDLTMDLFYPLFAEEDEAALEMLRGELQWLIEAFPVGRLYTDEGVLLWQKGPMDG
jgi:hypothetical protein